MYSNWIKSQRLWCKSLWLTRAHQSFSWSLQEHCQFTRRYFWCQTQRNNNCFNSKVHFILTISIKFQSRIKRICLHYALEQSNPRVWGQIFPECLVNRKADGGSFFCTHYIKKMHKISTPQDIKPKHHD